MHKNAKEIIQDIANANTYEEIMNIKISHLNDEEYDIVQMLWDSKRRQVGGIGMISEKI